jgi:hypothetical protein
MTCVLSAWRLADPANPSPERFLGGGSYSRRHARKMSRDEASHNQMGSWSMVPLLRYSVACRQCETRSHVPPSTILYSTVDSGLGPPRVCGNEDLPLLYRLDFCSRAVFSPDVVFFQPMIATFFQPSTYDRPDPGDKGCKCWVRVVCWPRYRERYKYGF